MIERDDQVNSTPLEAIKEFQRTLEALNRLTADAQERLAYQDGSSEGDFDGFAPYLVKLQLLWGVLGHSQQFGYKCTMPNNIAHDFASSVKVCSLKPAEHRFCRYHRLKKCPYHDCDGDLI